MIVILTGVRFHLTVVLLCISLIISDSEHIFHVSIGQLYVFFGKMSIWASSHVPFLVLSMKTLTLREAE